MRFSGNFIGYLKAYFLNSVLYHHMPGEYRIVGELI
jgi:hypothetical protein